MAVVTVWALGKGGFLVERDVARAGLNEKGSIMAGEGFKKLQVFVRWKGIEGFTLSKSGGVGPRFFPLQACLLVKLQLDGR